MTPPSVLITGGAGFIATNLADSLIGQGRSVVLLDNLSRPGVGANLDWLSRTYPGRFRLIVGDIRDPAVVDRALEGVTHVSHFAAQVAVTTSLDRPLDDFDVNARGTLTVLEAVRRRGDVSLLFTSTNKVYGDLQDLRLERYDRRYLPTDDRIGAAGVGEDRPLAFHSPYGCSKGAADQYVLDYARTFGVPAVVFRMSCIYGPHQFGTEDQGWVSHFVRAALEGARLTLYGDGCQVRDLLFVEDLIAAMLAVEIHLPALAGEAFNIGGGPAHAASLLEVTEEIGRLTGRPLEVLHAPWRAADQRFYVSDHGKFSAATGWRPVTSVRDGLTRLLAWARQAHAAPALATTTWG